MSEENPAYTWSEDAEKLMTRLKEIKNPLVLTGLLNMILVELADQAEKAGLSPNVPPPATKSRESKVTPQKTPQQQKKKRAAASSKSDTDGGTTTDTSNRKGKKGKKMNDTGTPTPQPKKGTATSTPQSKKGTATPTPQSKKATVEDDIEDPSPTTKQVKKEVAGKTKTDTKWKEEDDPFDYLTDVSMRPSLVGDDQDDESEYE